MTDSHSQWLLSMEKWEVTRAKGYEPSFHHWGGRFGYPIFPFLSLVMPLFLFLSETCLIVMCVMSVLFAQLQASVMDKLIGAMGCLFLILVLCSYTFAIHSLSGISRRHLIQRLHEFSVRKISHLRVILLVEITMLLLSAVFYAEHLDVFESHLIVLAFCAYGCSICRTLIFFILPGSLFSPHVYQSWANERLALDLDRFWRLVHLDLRALMTTKPFDEAVIQQISQLCCDRHLRFLDLVFPAQTQSLCGHWAWHENGSEAAVFSSSTRCPLWGEAEMDGPLLTRKSEMTAEVCRQCVRGVQWRRYSDFATLPVVCRQIECMRQSPLQLVDSAVTQVEPVEPPTGDALGLEGLSSRDLTGNSLCRNWLTEALFALSVFPTILPSLFISKTYSPEGVYAVRLFHVGRWRTVVVDDLFPCYIRGRPVFTDSTKLWPLILEKAVAKIYGSYERIFGLDLALALTELSGMRCVSLPLRSAVVDLAKSWWHLLGIWRTCCSASREASDAAQSVVVCLQVREEYHKTHGLAWPVVNMLVVGRRWLLCLVPPPGISLDGGPFSQSSSLWDPRMRKIKEATRSSSVTENCVWMEFRDAVHYCATAHVCCRPIATTPETGIKMFGSFLQGDQVGTAHVGGLGPEFRLILPGETAPLHISIRLQRQGSGLRSPPTARVRLFVGLVQYSPEDNTSITPTAAGYEDLTDDTETMSNTSGRPWNILSRLSVAASPPAAFHGGGLDRWRFIDCWATTGPVLYCARTIAASRYPYYLVTACLMDVPSEGSALPFSLEVRYESTMQVKQITRARSTPLLVAILDILSCRRQMVDAALTESGNSAAGVDMTELDQRCDDAETHGRSCVGCNWGSNHGDIFGRQVWCTLSGLEKFRIRFLSAEDRRENCLFAIRMLLSLCRPGSNITHLRVEEVCRMGVLEMCVNAMNLFRFDHDVQEQGLQFLFLLTGSTARERPQVMIAVQAFCLKLRYVTIVAGEMFPDLADSAYFVLRNLVGFGQPEFPGSNYVFPTRVGHFSAASCVCSAIVARNMGLGPTKPPSLARRCTWLAFSACLLGIPSLALWAHTRVRGAEDSENALKEEEEIFDKQFRMSMCGRSKSTRSTPTSASPSISKMLGRIVLTISESAVTDNNNKRNSVDEAQSGSANNDNSSSSVMAGGDPPVVSNILDSQPLDSQPPPDGGAETPEASTPRPPPPVVVVPDAIQPGTVVSEPAAVNNLPVPARQPSIEVQRSVLRGTQLQYVVDDVDESDSDVVCANSVDAQFGQDDFGPIPRMGEVRLRGRTVDVGFQMFRFCHSCEHNKGLPVCTVCATRCHAGHSLSLPRLMKIPLGCCQCSNGRHRCLASNQVELQQLP